MPPPSWGIFSYGILDILVGAFNLGVLIFFSGPHACLMVGLRHPILEKFAPSLSQTLESLWFSPLTPESYPISPHLSFCDKRPKECTIKLLNYENLLDRLSKEKGN